ncbi:SGNH hydrolase-type esterase domain-containing protein [Bombardia bombarda]|uniref:SGNH hydrolase-type esterase domain-containing protein n=1 Tax=Bombardia bombarda TaxID=252184 RepID=A0AA39XBR4_9PEZI|nr:SGNH hydrolase-type esterase domain-containing protein [Bombardia bombarda]
MLLRLVVALCSVQLVKSQSYDDWSWVKSFAAVGDSFTAGIGAGRLWSNDQKTRDCSRYDGAWPVVMQRYMGSVTDFQYPACSGDTSSSIMSQIDGLRSGIDLAVLSAGGNDLCLSNIIAQCIISRFSSEQDCTNAINQANNGITSFLRENVKTLLHALDAKMNSGGVIVLSLYAQYFDESTDECTAEQWGWPLGGLRLTRDRRNLFNKLVRDANHELKFAVYDGREKDGFSNARVVFADWDDWPYLQGGLMCQPGQNPDPTKEPKLMFFKMDTTRVPLDNIPAGPIKIRGNVSDTDDMNLLEETVLEAELEAAWLEARTVASSIEEASANISYPLPLVLDKRGITAPTCPSGVLKNVVSYFLPDSIGKIFHPNILGHQVIASFALDSARIARAGILGISPPGCAATNSLTCFAEHNTGEYTSSYAAYSATADFCDSVGSGYPSGVANWQYSKTYYQGAIDEVEFRLELSNGASSFDHDQCTQAVNSLLDSCDKYSSNPLNFKQGGANTLGSYKYTIQPKKQNRPWPYPTEPKQSCEGWYKFVLDAYDVYGAGWAGWDWGQQSLRPNTSSCIGGGITNWHFEYFDKPDANGYEWHAWFNTPIWTRARCYNNNKVQGASGGGGSGGCKGNG